MYWDLWLWMFSKELYSTIENSFYGFINVMSRAWKHNFIPVMDLDGSSWGLAFEKSQNTLCLPFIHQDVALFFFSSESLKKSFKNLINSRRLESLAIGETLLVSVMSCDLGSGQIGDFIHLCLTCSRPHSPSLSWVPTALQTVPVGSPRPRPWPQPCPPGCFAQFK